MRPHFRIQLNKWEKLLIVDFGSADYEIQDNDPKILSEDQRNLLHINSAIKTGNFLLDLSVRETDLFSYSRWLTAANRVFKMYVSVKTPSDEHKLLVSFILKS